MPPAGPIAVSIAIKICGLTDQRALTMAVDAGADFVGFVFYRRSPRFIDPEQAAALAATVPRHVTTVGLFVDPTDADLDNVLNTVSLGMIQLHGKETPARAAAVGKAFNLPIAKALGIATSADVAAASAFDGPAQWLLFDAKPPKDATRPGGNALAFDWTLMRGYTGQTPWMLAGGLTPKNVQAAVKASGARAVDVSSGVETRPGVKSPAKIRAFINAVRAVSP